MKLNPISNFIFLGCLIVFGCSGNPDIDTKADIESIQKLSDQWTTAIIAQDVYKILDCYVEDAVQMQAKSPIINGKKAIKAWYQTWINDTTMTYSAITRVIDIAKSRDIGYERGVYCLSFKTQAGKLDKFGKYLTIWKKIEGRWKAVADIGNDDQ